MAASQVELVDKPKEDTDPPCLASKMYTIEELVTTPEYQPHWRSVNKQVIAEIATPPGTAHSGSVSVSRWAQPAYLPHSVKTTQVQSESGYFLYKNDEDPKETHWHVNFADQCLFGYAEGSLFAQDEYQAVEHPILVSVGKAMDDEASHGMPALRRLTKDTNGATPVLIERAPRRCAIDTDGIYGDRFQRATIPTIQKATTPLDPPTISNIVAIAAPSPSNGLYNEFQIYQAFLTAYTGYRALVLCQSTSGTDAVLHTGHWGCGAFGGNKGLMAAIQILAAGTAGVKRIHFWYGSTEMDKTAVKHGMDVAAALSSKLLRDVIDLLVAAEYSWGGANENHVPYQPPRKCILTRKKSPLAAASQMMEEVPGRDVIQVAEVLGRTETEAVLDHHEVQVAEVLVGDELQEAINHIETAECLPSAVVDVSVAIVKPAAS